MISYIPQRTGISISMTVREVCLLGFNPQLHMLESYNFNMRHRADKAIDSVGLAGLYDTDFLTLSEGQKQLCILTHTYRSFGRFCFLMSLTVRLIFLTAICL